MLHKYHIVVIVILGVVHPPISAQEIPVREIPFLSEEPIIDGDLSEWEDLSFSDGHWDINRVMKSSWYSPKRNKGTIHQGEDTTQADLIATYYAAWDEHYLYLGAKIEDNHIDVEEMNHQDKRWYYKDAIAWFIEAPRDTIPEKFAGGDHAFAFILDKAKPGYGAWWRHGNSDESYIEEALPANAMNYEVVEENDGTYVLEAKIDMQKTFGYEDPNWTTPRIGDSYSMMIVHCDPDGGEYGGHLLIYGEGDLDSSWGEIILVGQKKVDGNAE